jgi:hypothetical protein
MNDYDIDSHYDYDAPEWEDCFECGGQEVVDPSSGVCDECEFDHAAAWLGDQGNEDAGMEAGLFGGDC